MKIQKRAVLLKQTCFETFALGGGDSSDLPRKFRPARSEKFWQLEDGRKRRQNVGKRRRSATARLHQLLGSQGKAKNSESCRKSSVSMC